MNNADATNYTTLRIMCITEVKLLVLQKLLSTLVVFFLHKVTKADFKHE